ncbi:MAG: cyclophilin-like fold protein [Lachnospiraceae bacterium]|nr:cyclophilin-like fold protein [Lachnospiraceae bacterium]
MKKVIVKAATLSLLLLLLFSLSACSAEQDEVMANENKEEKSMHTNTSKDIKVVVNDREFTATLKDSKAAGEFYDMLPLSIEMTEMNGNEKYYVLPQALSDEDEAVGTIANGDIMLYAGDYLVLFYEDFKTPYSYTRIGKIDDPVGLKEAVGNGNVTVDFTVAD